MSPPSVCVVWRRARRVRRVATVGIAVCRSFSPLLHSTRALPSQNKWLEGARWRSWQGEEEVPGYSRQYFRDCGQDSSDYGSSVRTYMYCGTSSGESCKRSIGRENHHASDFNLDTGEAECAALCDAEPWCQSFILGGNPYKRTWMRNDANFAKCYLVEYCTLGGTDYQHDFDQFFKRGTQPRVDTMYNSYDGVKISTAAGSGNAPVWYVPWLS